MSQPTRYRIAEQVISLLRGGSHSAGSTIRMQEVMVYVGQAINSLIKAEHYTTHLSTEDATPTSVTCFRYKNIPVKSEGGKSSIKLPVFPVKLIMGMGLYDIVKSGCREGNFIPVPIGQMQFMKSSPLMSRVDGNTYYEWEGMDVFFFDDIYKKGIKEVDVLMVVMDINSYTDHEPLPIPADMEGAVVTATYNLLTAQRPPDKRVDSSSENQP